MDYEKDPGWQYLRISREQMIQEQSVPYDSKKVSYLRVKR
jgi:myosin protein heavy chain